MIQARIPDAILRGFPVGASTAPLMSALRDGAKDDLPGEFVAWARRNGFDKGEAVELLPAIVPPPSDPAAIERQRRVGKRRLLLGGAVLLALGAVLPLLIGFLAARALSRDPDTDVGWPYALLVGGLGWLLVQVGPVFVLADLGNLLAHRSPDVLGNVPLPMWAITLGLVEYLVTFGGFALIARAKGLSPWLGLLGAISLLFRDRNRP